MIDTSKASTWLTPARDLLLFLTLTGGVLVYIYFQHLHNGKLDAGFSGWVICAIVVTSLWFVGIGIQYYALIRLFITEKLMLKEKAKEDAAYELLQQAKELNKARSEIGVNGVFTVSDIARKDQLDATARDMLIRIIQNPSDFS